MATSNNENKERYYQWTEEELIENFDVNPETGLSEEEAQTRLENDGYNEIEQETTPKWKMLVRQLNNVVIYILIVAAIVTFLIGSTTDSIIIAVVIVVNTLIGYYQEANASDALDQIRNMLSSEATVVRDDTRKNIDATELVVGDIVYVESGEQITADLRLIDADDLKVQESSLTGESGSVNKNFDVLEEETALAEQSNMAFSSTSATNGNATGIVVRTAEDTEIGQISTQVGEVQSTKTPLMQEIDNVGTGISYVILGIAVLLFIFGLVFAEYALGALALAVVIMVVGSIPEGLPATSSVILARGVSDMAKNKNTIVKTLPAAETLGSVDVIATDKTGTLTKNEMTAQVIVTKDHTYDVSGTGYKPEGEITRDGEPVSLESNDTLNDLIIAGHEANETVLNHEDDKWTINGEPTDGAFLTLFRKATGQEASDYAEIDRIPFSSDYRYVASLSENEKLEKRKIYIKGSPDKLIQMAKDFDESIDKEFWEQKVADLSEEGKRVIAVGYRDVDDTEQAIEHENLESGIQLLGLVGIIDPPREEVIDSIASMRKAGVEVKMITGDHPLTAKAIAESLGLADNIKSITGVELDKMSAEELSQTVNEYQVFARTTPENKIQIVEALQDAGQVTAMTGDGVNDAPALKESAIGVAMGIKGTDVAKDAADMVLVDDDFSTMSVAIREGRRIYDNIKKSILYLLPTSFGEGLIIFFTVLLQQDMPLSAGQMLWINMVSAITIQFAFIFEPAEEGVMEREPRSSDATIIGKRDAVKIGYISAIIAALGLVAFAWLTNSGVEQGVASTVVVNLIIMAKIFYFFNIRTTAPAYKELFANKKAYIVIGIMLILQLILTYVPFMQSIFSTQGLGPIHWLIAIVGGFIVLVIAEIDKFITRKIRSNN